MSEEAVEPETETAGVTTPESPGGTPPAQIERGVGSGSGGDGGGGSRRRSTPTQPGFFARTAQFLRDVRAEMRRVSWPSASMVKNTTIITLVAVVFFAIYLFLVDRVWSFLIEHLRTALGG